LRPLLHRRSRGVAAAVRRRHRRRANNCRRLGRLATACGRPRLPTRIEKIPRELGDRRMEAVFVLADEVLERLGETLCGVEVPFRGREDLLGSLRRSSAVMLQLPLQCAYTTTKGRAPRLWEAATCSKHCWKSGRSKTACVSAADATPLFSVTKPIDHTGTGADGAHPGERVDAEGGPGDCNGRQRTRKVGFAVVTRD